MLIGKRSINIYIRGRLYLQNRLKRNDKILNWIIKYQQIETMLEDMKITKNWMNSLSLFYNRKIPQSVCINVLREKFVLRQLSNSQQYLERWHNNKSPGHDRIHLGVFKNSKVKLLTDKICNLSLNQT